MLLESPEFAPFLRSARIDAYRGMQLANREERTRTPGQIRIQRRSTEDGKPGRLLRGAKRDHVVKQLAKRLRDFQLTPFEHEAPSRHGIRAQFCLSGQSWLVAEVEAISLVEEALTRIHAHRPTYEEGQREYSIPPDYCAWCGSPLGDEAHRGKHTSFCDEVCAAAAIKNRELSYHRNDTRAFDAAYDIIRRSQFPERQCTCGKSFRPRFPEQKHCSPECGFTARRTVPKSTCEHCGTKFQPVSNNGANRFCSTACHYAHGKEAKHRRECTWCGIEFMAAMPHAHNCSNACRIAERKNALGVKPATLSLHVFDHFVTLPAHALVDQRRAA